MLRFQYQQHTEPVLAAAEAVSEDKFHYPWSEPVRQKIAPLLAVALAASGAFFTPAAPFEEAVLESKFHYPWSEPVRFKPGLRAHLHPFSTIDTVASFPSANHMGWYANLSEPVREKIGLGVANQQFIVSQTIQPPESSTMIQGWYMELSAPVRLPIGLKAYLQQTTAYHPRLLPTPDVTAVMAATEINNDVAIFALNVYDSAGSVTSGEGARVSIIEVTPLGIGPTSIRES